MYGGLIAAGLLVSACGCSQTVPPSTAETFHEMSDSEYQTFIANHMSKLTDEVNAKIKEYNNSASLRAQQDVIHEIDQLTTKEVINLAETSAPTSYEKEHLAIFSDLQSADKEFTQAAIAQSGDDTANLFNKGLAKLQDAIHTAGKIANK